MPPTPDNAPAVAIEERLFSLVLALIATEIGLTKSDILSTVQGYRHRYVVGGDNASLERQFERDKDDIRDLGIPLETIESGRDTYLFHCAACHGRTGRGDGPMVSVLTTAPPDLTTLAKRRAAVFSSLIGSSTNLVPSSSVQSRIAPTATPR